MNGAEALLSLKDTFTCPPDRDAYRVLVDRQPTLELIEAVQAEMDRLRAVAETSTRLLVEAELGKSEKLTSDQAEGLLKRLSMHFCQPVMPVSRYCGKLREWARCVGDRARRMSDELLPNRHDWDKTTTPHWTYTAEAKAQQAEHDAANQRSRKEIAPNNERERKLDGLIEAEEYADSVDRIFRNIEKSNLLARILYGGEKVREKICPEHKGHWSGIEWGDTRCPHKCQLTGWIQEEADQGKPLPGVQAVQLVPTGEAPGEVTMIRDVDGQVLGKAVIQEVPKPRCGHICDQHVELICCLDAGHKTPHRDLWNVEWPL